MRFGLGWFAALALVGCSSGTVSTGSTSAGSTNSGATGGSSTGGTGGTVACPACTQDADCGEEGSATLGDTLVSEEASPEAEALRSQTNIYFRQAVEKAMEGLNDREREILRLRFGLDRGEPRTLEEVGEHFNLTRERIRQIEARAMSKLRHPSSDTGARDLLTV